MKKLVYLLFLFPGHSAIAQKIINIVPAPAEIKTGRGNFTINKETSIILEGSGLERVAEQLNNYLQQNYGFTISVTKIPAKENTIVLNYERMDFSLPGSYTMNITGKEIYIAGDNEEGVFYGIQTLIQLLPVTAEKNGNNNYPLSIPQLSITDHPRFAYRGMHLDVSRHFFSVEQVKKYIDHLAAYKFNTFHWHLTDDQGWRIEIKKYPKLTAVGGYRNGTIIGSYPGTGNDSIRYGGFYTQEQIKELVDYAADRYITIIPEIDIPGHSSAAIAAYPQLSCFPNESSQIPANTAWAGSREGKQVQQSWGVFEDVLCPSEYSFKFLEDVLNEVMQLFPSKYIHIGGDECPKESWKRSAFCQQLIKEKKLKDEHGLQSYFIQRIEKYINSKGKKIIGWNEILEGGLAPNATVMSWQGEQGGIAAAKQNHDVIMTPENPFYLNHAQSNHEDSVTQGGFNPIENVYNYEPVPKELNEKDAKHILGAQGNMWSEHLKNEKKLEYMLFPRIAALSEVLWSPKEKRNWEDFEKRLPGIFQRLDAANINHSNAYYDINATVLPKDDHKGIAWHLQTKTKGYVLMFKDEMETYFTVNPLIIERESHSNDTITYTGVLCKSYPDRKHSISEIKQTFYLNKATGKKITLANEPSQNYPGDGAFTLVNGVQNEKGLLWSSEFLGFSGSDLDATIDLGKTEELSNIKLHTLEQQASWIYLPSTVVASFSNDGINFTGQVELSKRTKNIFIADLIKGTNARYIRLFAKNTGIIPTGNPGSGNPAWLFVDEIEIL